MSQVISIRNLHVAIQGKDILKEVDLDIMEGKVHFLMGPNGSGKSTLARAIMGDPTVSITGGQIFFEGEDITTLSPDDRAKRGIFLGFQQPAEVSGVGMVPFLRNAVFARGGDPGNEEQFSGKLLPKLASLKIADSFLTRNLNEGFSGGEKKRSELLQLAVLQPKLAILDEFDSGLDVDGLRAAAAFLKKFVNEGKSLLVITHQGKIAEHLRFDMVHVLRNGSIVERGDTAIIRRIEKKGFHL